MKKLMITMLAAVGTAFGLFADDPAPITPISSTSFEAASEFDGEDLIVNLDGSKWTCNDDGATLKQGAYNGDAYVYPAETPRYSTFGDTQAKYLNVKTAFGKQLAYNEATTVGDNAVFFDQLVKFTAADEPMAVDENAKIAFYVMDLSEAETPVAETNLYVVSGKYVNQELSVVTNKLCAIDVTKWHRLTIKSMKGYAQDDVAFEVFLDGVALELSAPAIDAASAAGMTDTAKAINSAKKLFPSMVANTLQLAGIALAGMGAIDDVIATTESPAWAVDKFVTLGWDKDVTGFKYQIGAGDVVTMSGLTAAGTISIVAGSFDVTLSDMTFAENRGFDTVACDGGCSFDPENMKISFGGANQTATITSKDTTPRVYVGNVAYPSLMAALENPIADGTTITLAADLTGANGVTVDDNGITLAKFKSNGSIVLDLAGHTIGLATGAELTGGLLNVNQCAGFTLTDSTGNGRVDGGIKVVNYNGTVFVATGANPFFVDGKVDVAAGATSEISGGSFDYETNKKADADEFALTLKDGFKATHTGDYWVVSELPAHKLTVTGVANATFTINDEDEAEVELKEGAEYTVVAEADKNYEYKSDAIYTDNWAYDEVNGTVTNIGVMGTSDIALTVPAPTAKVFTATYLEWDESTPVAGIDDSFKTFTVENASSKVLPQPTKAGYEFVAWYASTEDGEEPVGNEIFVNTIEAEEDGFTVYAKWKALPTGYNITFASVENGTLETSVTNGVNEGSVVNVIATPASADYECTEITTNGAAITGTSFAMPAEDVIVGATFTMKAQPFDPGKEIKTDKTPEQINASAEAKREFLKAPEGATVGDTYYANFSAVSAGEGTIKFVLNEVGEKTVADAEKAADTTVLNKVLTTTEESAELTITDAVPGFYYSLKQNKALEALDFTDYNKLGGSEGGVKFNLQKDPASGFYQVIVTPTIVPEVVTE